MFNQLWCEKLTFYNVDEYTQYISQFDFKIIKNTKKESFYNIPASFDIETTSFTVGDKKCAIMYEWTFCIAGCCCIGREWCDFTKLLDNINKTFSKARLLVYVHNLSYEFQWLYKRYNFDKVFALDNRKVCYGKYRNVEFRCSYILSGVALASLGHQLNTYKVEKLEGYLDYDLIHTPKTKLTDKEIQYCLNDCYVVVAYIQEMIEQYDGKIFNIPLTKTGKVRKVCRNTCRKTKFYYKLMKKLRLESDEYLILKKAFSGGFTHSNAAHTSVIHENVYSLDECSAYPSVMVCEKFPMGKGVKVQIRSKKHFEYICKKYCCVFHICFTNLHPTQYEHPISKSKCVILENGVENNGRIISADRLSLYCTNVDFEVFKHFYRWDNMGVKECYIYRKDYLPPAIINNILEFYEKKTTLKGVDGSEIEYALMKELLNSMYGMIVTDIFKERYEVNNQEWCSSMPDLDAEIKKYNESFNRFLYYPWGVFVTAYARRNLFAAINQLKDDYIYSDTDSVKFLHYEKHKKWFDEYNQHITKKIQHSCDVNGLDFKKTQPLTIDGVCKPLGVWEIDGVYRLFKTLGAKRYAYFVDEKFTFTLAGCGKKIGSDYLHNTSVSDFDTLNKFNKGLYIPPEHTGKLTHTYCDEAIEGMLYDYQGQPYQYHELSYVHLEPCEFTLDISKQYEALLKTLRTELIL